MKPRVEKKLSKKILTIFKNSERRDFQNDAERSWIDNEFEGGYSPSFERTSKATREMQQSRVGVNNVPSIGGEFDSYSGDASEHYTLYAWAETQVLMDSMDWDSFDFELDAYPESAIRGRLTGKKVLERLRQSAQEAHP